MRPILCSLPWYTSRENFTVNRFYQLRTFGWGSVRGAGALLKAKEGTTRCYLLAYPSRRRDALTMEQRSSFQLNWPTLGRENFTGEADKRVFFCALFLSFFKIGDFCFGVLWRNCIIGIFLKCAFLNISKVGVFWVFFPEFSKIGVLLCFILDCSFT